MRGVEFLLEWAGVSLSSLSKKQTVDQFIEEFENGIGVMVFPRFAGDKDSVL